MRALDRIGVATILAKYRNQYRNKRILFPCYLFVDIVEHWRRIPRADYVRRLFISGDKPCRLPDKYIAELQAKMRPDGTIEMDTQERFHIGQRVQILRGAFRDIIASYDGLNAKQQETVLVDFLGRKVKMEFQPGDLASA